MASSTRPAVNMNSARSQKTCGSCEPRAISSRSFSSAISVEGLGFVVPLAVCRPRLMNAEQVFTLDFHASTANRFFLRTQDQRLDLIVGNQNQNRERINSSILIIA